MDPTGVLLRTQLFGDLTEQDVKELLPHLMERSYQKGEALWYEGDPADALYILAEGQVKSYRVGLNGGEVILVINSAVDTAGEIGLFHPTGLRQVNVSAMTPTRCLTLSRSTLLAFMARHPRAMERMLERISSLTARAAYSFSGVAFDDIRRRVASALLALGDEFGESTPEGVRIRIGLSQSTLAALVAASRERVNRALSTLISDGAVSQRGEHFVIHDRAALRHAARRPD